MERAFSPASSELLQFADSCIHRFLGCSFVILVFVIDMNLNYKKRECTTKRCQSMCNYSLEKDNHRQGVSRQGWFVIAPVASLFVDKDSGRCDRSPNRRRRISAGLGASHHSARASRAWTSARHSSARIRATLCRSAGGLVKQHPGPAAASQRSSVPFRHSVQLHPRCRRATCRATHLPRQRHGHRGTWSTAGTSRSGH